jgi:hypothetical protein
MGRRYCKAQLARGAKRRLDGGAELLRQRVQIALGHAPGGVQASLAQAGP